MFDATCLRAKCEQNHNLGYRMLKRFANLITARLHAARLQLLDIYRLDDGSKPLVKKKNGKPVKTAKAARSFTGISRNPREDSHIILVYQDSGVSRQWQPSMKGIA